MGPSDVCVCMCVMVHLLSDDGPADLPSMRKLGGDEAIFGEVAPSPGHVPAGFCPPWPTPPLVELFLTHFPIASSSLPQYCW